MPAINVIVESEVSRSARARQLEAIFDVPPQVKARIEFKGELPIEDRDWNVGLIVGPSGCGKSTILREIFGAEPRLDWGAASVIDDFAKDLSIETISSACQAVGFNTIPAWLRPYAVLSNGERFRVELARRLLEVPGTIAVDEFTSVVDRQVAQIGAHAVQKQVRRVGKRFVAASCHYDIIEWLQPDWMLEPATMTFQWRELQRRPQLNCEIFRTTHAAWRIFAPFHYMSAELHRSAKCFAMTINGRLAAFMGLCHRPHPTVRGLWAVSRQVVLPDFQGLGIAFAFADRIGAMHRAIGRRLRHYPAHPAFMRGFDRSPFWRLDKKPVPRAININHGPTVGKMGGRPCAVFEYVGPAFEDKTLARLLLI